MVKEGPWVGHLTLGSKRGGADIGDIITILYHEKVPVLTTIGFNKWFVFLSLLSDDIFKEKGTQRQNEHLPSVLIITVNK